jgi:RNA polymerase sigma-70 factor, ECF subfamily
MLAIRHGAPAALPRLGIRARHGQAVLRIHGVWSAGSQMSQRGRAGAADPPAPDLECLLSSVAGGDRDAFEAVCHQVDAAVYTAVLRVVRDRSQSEEVAQDVLVEVWRIASRFDPAKGSAMAWVLMIAHRRAVDRVRSAQKSAERELRNSHLPVAYDEVAETVEARMERARVRQCLGSLTDLQRESITLAYYGGYTYRQVAERLGVAAGTVSTRMRDGLLRLRNCLERSDEN